MDNTQNTNYKKTEIGLIPEDWEVVRLGDVAEISMGKTPKRSNKEYWENGKYPWVTISDLKGKYIKTTKEKISDKAFTEVFRKKLIPKGTLLMSFKLTIGKTAILDIDAVHNEAIIHIYPSEIADKEFLYFALPIVNFFKYSMRAVKGNTLNKDKLKNLLIPLPPLPEQKAIATVLDKIRQAIEQTEEVIQANKELKKSLMKHLFTYGVVPPEETDKVKLKETEIGLIPEHWEIERLGNIATIKGGKRLPKGHNFAEEITKYPYLRVSDFKNGKVKIENLKYLTEEDAQILKNYRIFEGEIYISIAGTIGLSGIIPKDLSGAYLTENAAKIIINGNNKLNSSYLVYVFNSHIGKFQIESNVSKTSQPKLALSKLKQFKIPLPPLDEQKQIAEILSKIDQKIEAEENKKETLEKLFKSLLNNLMTGKIRLNKNFIKKFEEN